VPNRGKSPKTLCGYREKLGRSAFSAEQLLHYLPLEFDVETSLIPHGKILSIPYIGYPDPA